MEFQLASPAAKQNPHFQQVLRDSGLSSCHASASEVFEGFWLKGPVQQFATASADSGSDKTSNAEVCSHEIEHMFMMAVRYVG